MKFQNVINYYLHTVDTFVDVHSELFFSMRASIIKNKTMNKKNSSPLKVDNTYNMRVPIQHKNRNFIIGWLFCGLRGRAVNTQLSRRKNFLSYFDS